jgi:hypothetical protein
MSKVKHRTGRADTRNRELGHRNDSVVPPVDGHDGGTNLTRVAPSAVVRPRSCVPPRRGRFRGTRGGEFLSDPKHPIEVTLRYDDDGAPRRSRAASCDRLRGARIAQQKRERALWSALQRNVVSLSSDGRRVTTSLLCSKTTQAIDMARRFHFRRVATGLQTVWIGWRITAQETSSRRFVIGLAPRSS